MFEGNTIFNPAGHNEETRGYLGIIRIEKKDYKTNLIYKHSEDKTVQLKFSKDFISRHQESIQRAFTLGKNKTNCERVFKNFMTSFDSLLDYMPAEEEIGVEIWLHVWTCLATKMALNRAELLEYQSSILKTGNKPSGESELPDQIESKIAEMESRLDNYRLNLEMHICRFYHYEKAKQAAKIRQEEQGKIRPNNTTKAIIPI
jgi:hypothetical protein